MEIWKDIPGFEGRYLISNKGRLKSIIFKKHRILKPGIDGKYRHRTLSLGKLKGEKHFKIHVLVAIAFLDHKPCGHELVVDHINNNPLDNRLENLQIITHRENISKDKTGNSKYAGVHFSKHVKKWQAGIVINNKKYHIGTFTCEKEANLAYQKALKEWEENKELPKRVSQHSNYKGVSYYKRSKKWYAVIRTNGKNKYLGSFDSEYEAHVCYQKEHERRKK